MPKLRIKNEWKLYVGLGVLFLVFVGYLYWISRPPMEGGEYLWKVLETVDERTLKLKGQGQEKQFRLIGLEIPHAQKEEAKALLTDDLKGSWVRIDPITQTKDDVEEGFVYISGEDVHARLIRQGLATMDRDQKKIDIRPYIELELEAKREQRGLWKEKDRGAQ